MGNCSARRRLRNPAARERENVFFFLPYCCLVRTYSMNEAMKQMFRRRPLLSRIEVKQKNIFVYLFFKFA